MKRVTNKASNTKTKQAITQEPQAVVRKLEPPVRYEQQEPIIVGIDPYVAHRLQELDLQKEQCDAGIKQCEEKIIALRNLKASMDMSKEELVRMDLRRSGRWEIYATPIIVADNYLSVSVQRPPVKADV